MKDIPVLVDEKAHCCGCTACKAICPVHAIEMKKDEEGFLYPNIDEQKCVRCYKCMSVCAFKSEQKKRGFY